MTIFSDAMKEKIIHYIMKSNYPKMKILYMFNNEYDSKYNLHENENNVNNNSEGKDSVSVMYCRMCGNKLESGSLFCSICGSKIKKG